MTTLCNLINCQCSLYKGAVKRRVHALALREYREEREYAELCNREAWRANADGRPYNPHRDYTNE